MQRNWLTVILVALACAAAGADTNSSARARAFAALPDWTGIWQSAVWPMDVSGRVPGGEEQLRNTLQLLRHPPYNPEWEAKYQAGIANVSAFAGATATFKTCARAFPALMEGPWMFQIAVLPDETLLIFENGQVRHIYTDGRHHPLKEDLWPTRLGDSVGHWEGGALVIDTIALTAEPIAPRAWASLLSDRAQFTERLRRVSASELEDQLTIDDPIAFEHPWRITLRYRRLPDMNRMIAYDCIENDRNPVVNGKLTITAPQ